MNGEGIPIAVIARKWPLLWMINLKDYYTLTMTTALYYSAMKLTKCVTNDYCNGDAW